MTIQCPCCGGEMKWAMPREELPRQFLSLDLRRTGQVTLMAKLILYLSNPIGGVRTLEDIASFVYNNDIHGGPLEAHNALCVTISRSRKRLSAFGWQIHAHNNKRYSLIPIDGLKERAVSAASMVMDND